MDTTRDGKKLRLCRHEEDHFEILKMKKDWDYYRKPQLVKKQPTTDCGLLGPSEIIHITSITTEAEGREDSRNTAVRLSSVYDREAIAVKSQQYGCLKKITTPVEMSVWTGNSHRAHP